MEKSGLIILGSSRSTGNTAKIAAHLASITDYDMIDLTQFNIGPYDYQHKHRNDDFLPLIRKIVASYDNLIFATPVYWYSMSGTMKIFFDRLTDCMQIEKETGRKLRGKSMGMLSCGSDAEIKPGFEMPFRESANYLGMRYAGEIHTWLEDGKIPLEVEEKILVFAERFLTITHN